MKPTFVCAFILNLSVLLNLTIGQNNSITDFGTAPFLLDTHPVYSRSKSMFLAVASDGTQTLVGIAGEMYLFG
ncbi:MAG: hypothetical protein Kow0042_22010 [Calditrichia bacterium]